MISAFPHEAIGHGGHRVCAVTHLKPSGPPVFRGNHNSALRPRSLLVSLCFCECKRVAMTLRRPFNCVLQGSTWWSISAWRTFWEAELMMGKVYMFVWGPCRWSNKQSKWALLLSASSIKKSPLMSQKNRQVIFPMINVRTGQPCRSGRPLTVKLQVWFPHWAGISRWMCDLHLLMVEKHFTSIPHLPDKYK